MTLDLRDVPLRDALSEIARQGEVELVYSRHVVPVERRVSIRVKDVSPTEALKAVLRGTDVDVRASADGEIVLAKRPKRAAAVEEQRVREGTISGRVTDVRTGVGVEGASVTVEGTSLATTTREDGGFLVGRVLPGTYTVTARRLGYARASRQVTVAGDEEVTVNFALEPSAGILDQVVVTGTVVPTEVKAIPTPVTVITAEQIERQRPNTIHEVIRQAVPGAVSWDTPAQPTTTFFSVRGASTLVGGGVQMKVFVDGIEVASLGNAAVDPSSIERIEVIRGPQAAAIYGSAAIGGVIQIFTKRGDPSLTRPRVNAEVALGAIQTPYAGFSRVLRQEYKASVHGGGSDVSYNFGAGYWRISDWVPNGEISEQTNPSVYGGMRFARGIITVDISGRYETYNAPQVFEPAVHQTGFVPQSKPNYLPIQVHQRTLGTRIELAPTTWWQHTITVGIDQFDSESERSRRRLTTPGDTLLEVFNLQQTKTSIGYNTSLRGALGPSVSGSLMVGFDHWSFPTSIWSTSGALNTAGTIRIAPGQSIFASRDTTSNTGYFAQGQLGFREVLFLTAGLRAERNTNFGDELDTPVSPRVGLAYVREMGWANLKLRGSWGRAIRAPASGAKLGSASGTGVTLANPHLAPERQQGWDVGVDAVFGGRGSLGVTYYDQTAEDLIQSLILQVTPVFTQQNQNVGRVKNAGVEVEGTLFIDPLQLKGQYGYVRSRIEQLSPTYTGDLRIGDQSEFTPRHTAGASATLALPRGTTLATGLTYVGSWNGLDALALFRCFGGTGPCQPGPGFRNYVVEYPGFVKVNATVTQRITQQLSGFASVDNITNNEAHELVNNRAVMGRITTVGLRFSY